MHHAVLTRCTSKTPVWRCLAVICRSEGISSCTIPNTLQGVARARYFTEKLYIKLVAQ